jgi:DGQHR domain-containing protein
MEPKLENSSLAQNELDEIDQIDHEEQRNKRVLARLLDRYANQRGKFFATRGEMGVYSTPGGNTYRSPSFVVSHELNWVATNILMGSEMPFMGTHIKNGRLEINEANVDELKQRKPDWSRQLSLTAYLVHDRSRKFASILAVINPDWVDDPSHENWGKDRRALKSAAIFEPLDSTGRIGLINLDAVRIYALDGQHRVMGIKGLKQLVENNFFILTSDNKPKAKIERDDFLNKFRVDFSALQSLMSERIHIEYIPAVLAGETREEGSRRVRSIFVAINSYAKPPKKGENAVLDEASGYAIVARRSGVSHPLFRSQSGSRINWKSSALPDRSEWITTLEALVDIAKLYLVHAVPKLAERWEPPFTGDIVPLRPNEDDLDQVSLKFRELLDFIQQLPVFQAIDRSDDPVATLGKLRAFPEVDEDPNSSDGHLFLRPIGQQILAEAVGELIAENSPSRMTLQEIFGRLVELDSRGRFQAHKPSNLWYGVTYDFTKGKMIVAKSSRNLAVRLLKYLIRGANTKTQEELLREVVTARTVEGHWKNFNGQVSTLRYDLDGKPLLDGIALPAPRD